MTGLEQGNTEQATDLQDVDLKQAIKPEDQQQEQEDADTEEPAEDQEAEDSEDEETIITLDDKPVEPEPETEDNSVMRKMRDIHKEQKKRIRELEEQINKKQSTEQQELEPLPARPKIEDFDYDAEKYDRALDDWYGKKQKHDLEKQKKQAEIQKQQETWQGKVSAYNTSKAELKISDYEVAEDVVQQTLSPTQQGVILDVADNPALLVYALGKNPEKLKELSEIKNPVHYIAAVAKLETKLKMTKTRKPKAPPEKQLSGTGAAATSSDAELERLEAKAAKTGDRSEIYKYKRKLNKRS
jgi:hypothetical protein